MYNNIVKAPEFYKAGIYIRLSEADQGKSYEAESESVLNQRNILMKFVKDNGFIFVGEYVDDGYSGTDFDRPGFNLMMEDLKKGLINLVIVKDLSRLGRDHILTGYYVENYFPENGIRFISIQESYDNFKLKSSNDSVMFIFACNDFYSKQNSVKIRNVLEYKKRKGKFIGSAPSYGYMRDPNDKGHLLPDPEYAPVVKKIFEMANNGVGLSDITSYLNDNKIKTPSSLKRKNPRARSKYNSIWTISSVKKILKNQMYVGDMVQNIQYKRGYKTKKKLAVPKENWIVVKNTHEPLIDRMVFEKIQNNVKRTNITNITKREKRLFENLLYCKECGNTLTITYRKNHNYWTINCNKYSRDPKRHLCYPHFMPYDQLEEALLEVVKKTCKKYLDAINVPDLALELKDRKKNNLKIEARIFDLEKKEKELLNKLDMLYEDKFRGLVSDEMYKRIANETEVLLTKSKTEVKKLKADEKTIQNKTDDLKEYEDKIKSLIDLENPTRELMQAIIDKIVIDKDKNIEIIFKFSILNSI